jgi:rod shape-determining protein MreC
MPEQKKNKFHFGLSEYLFIVLFLFSGIMLTFSSKSFVLDFDRIGFSAMSTMQNGINIVLSKAVDTINAVKETSRLRRENDLLTEKLKNYEYMQRSNAEIRKENERLKKLLDFSVELEQKNYPAQIIGRNVDSLYSVITVNKGSTQGIRKNLPVIAIQNGNTGIVGKVINVGRNTSQIMPVYDVHCSISARIQTTRDIGLVTGQGAANAPLEMQYIKKRVLDELHYGDIVVSSGENDNYIENIPLGTISKITVVDYDSSLRIELSPAIDFARLENVIIVDRKEPNDRKED